jgi:hypothetical protein
MKAQKTQSTYDHHERMANMTFATVFPLYVHKIERKGRNKAELLQVITWLTGYDELDLVKHIEAKSTFKVFFDQAHLHPNAYMIKGTICGYRIEEIDNPLTKKVRYLDKLVDELAKGKELKKILRL